MQPFGSEGDSSPVQLFQVPLPGWATHSLGFTGRPADRLKLKSAMSIVWGWMDGWMDQPSNQPRGFTYSFRRLG